MTKSRNIDTNPSVLDDQTVELISSSLKTNSLPEHRAEKLKAKIKDRIANESSSADDLYLTIPSEEGSWKEIAPKIEKKILNVDKATNMESFLVRIHPGCDVEGHSHDHDELCLMLEGELTLGDIHLRAGDFHLARKGSQHGTIRSDIGALLFIQAPAGEQYAA